MRSLLVSSQIRLILKFRELPLREWKLQFSVFKCKVVFYKENVRRVPVTAVSLINISILIPYFPHMQKGHDKANLTGLL